MIKVTGGKRTVLSNTIPKHLAPHMNRAERRAAIYNHPVKRLVKKSLNFAPI
ncbi:MAG: hypothetical protein PF495_17290 [Spirochaetales bacterium]|jgi:hypothetical protein|nr:hypothetical protein [Spirochaetales bacterium]